MASTDEIDIQEETKDGNNNNQKEEETEASVQNSQETEQGTRDSRRSDSGPSCRVCMELLEETSKLISPCKCSGSQQFIHFHCLKEWIEHSNENVCGVCKTKYDGLVMTASRVPFWSFLKANSTVMGALMFGVCSAVIAAYIILIGFLTSWNAEHNEDIFFIWKDLLSYINALLLFLYLVCIGFALFGLYKCYQDYDETHKSFKVSGFEERITREAIETKGTKEDKVVIVMEGQNAEPVQTLE